MYVDVHQNYTISKHAYLRENKHLFFYQAYMHIVGNRLLCVREHAYVRTLMIALKR